MGVTNWTGLGDAVSWSDALNWDNGVPGSNDLAIIASGTTSINVPNVQSVTITGGTHTMANTFTSQQVSVSNGTLAVGGQTFTITTGGSPKLTLISGSFTGTGPVDIGYILQSGGTLTQTNLTLRAHEGGTNKTLEATAGTTTITTLTLTGEAKQLDRTGGLAATTLNVTNIAVGGAPTFTSDFTCTTLTCDAGAGRAMSNLAGTTFTAITTTITSGRFATQGGDLGIVTMSDGEIAHGTTAGLTFGSITATGGTVVCNSTTDITCSGDWSLTGTSTFTHGDGNVIVNGTSTVTQDPDRGDFHTLTVNGSGITVTLNSDMKFDDNITATAGTLTFTGGYTYTFLIGAHGGTTSTFDAGTTVNLIGDAGNYIVLRSSSATTQCTWQMDTSNYTVQYVDVQDNDASSGSEIDATHPSNIGEYQNNINWKWRDPPIIPVNGGVVVPPGGEKQVVPWNIHQGQQDGKVSTFQVGGRSGDITMEGSASAFKLVFDILATGSDQYRDMVSWMNEDTLLVITGSSDYVNGIYAVKSILPTPIGKDDNFLRLHLEEWGDT